MEHSTSVARCWGLFMDPDDEDSDEDLPTEKKKTVPPQSQFFVKRTILRFSDKEFQMHFRI